MTQQNVSTPDKNTGELYTATEFNNQKSVINNNSSDAETRISALEGEESLKLNDTAIDTTSAWSSDKINLELSSKITSGDIPTLVSDFTNDANYITSGDIPTELPTGTTGDILYYTGANWTSLAAPTSGSVLRHNGTAPYWEQPEACP